MWVPHPSAGGPGLKAITESGAPCLTFETWVYRQVAHPHPSLGAPLMRSVTAHGWAIGVQCIIISALSLVPNRLAAATGRASGAHRRAEGSAPAPRRALARRPAGRSPARAGGPAPLPGRRRPAPRPSPPMRANLDDHMMLQGRSEVHQPLHREPLQLVPLQRGNLRPIHAQHACRLQGAL